MSLPTPSFRTKVALLLSGVVMLFGLLAVLHARGTMRRILGEEVEKRGEAVARELAANSANLLLTDDLVGLYDLANQAMLNDPDLRYVLLVDSENRVRVNTFGRGMPAGLLAANHLENGGEARLIRIGTDEGLVRDVAVGILDGRAGVLRVGMSDWSVEAAVSRNTRELLALVVIAIATGLAVSYCLSFFLTRPLTRLLAAVRQVARGDLSQRIPSPPGDEVGQLGRAFNVMAGELESKESARRQLMEKVISSQEEERVRVARELHDELAQRLTSALLSLEAADTSAAEANDQTSRAMREASRAVENSLREARRAGSASAVGVGPRAAGARDVEDLGGQLELVLATLTAAEAASDGASERARAAIEHARRVTESSLGETRKLIGDLRPTVLDDLGLLPAIRSYAESRLQPLGTIVTVTAKGLDGALLPALETAVFRIAQEAINNVGRHAHAARATIAIGVANGTLSGEISDNGCGFQQRPGTLAEWPAGSGLGLQGMEERAALLGGTLTVDSAAGEGTRVSFCIPLRSGQGS